MVTRDALMHYTQQLLQIDRYQDYCPNGLQVEGRAEIQHIVSGVSASMALLEAAHQIRADLILVHHGYFWRNENPNVVGMKRNRLAFLLNHNINLAAYHLPLDAHPELGNNVQLGKHLGWQADEYAGQTNLVACTQLQTPTTLLAISTLIEERLQRKPMFIGNPAQLVRKVAWCTGAAQSYFDAAVALGADVFISGEISEQTTHQALETGVAYISAGHHATEKYGVQALGGYLAQKFDLQHTFIDIENPV